MTLGSERRTASMHTPHEDLFESADVAVFGATAGGAVAAVAAAREGARVILLATGRHVGGMLTGGLSRTDVERQEGLIGGLAGEVFSRIGASYGAGPAWRFEPHVAESVLLDLLGEARVTVRRDASLAGIEMAGRRIRGIRTGGAQRVEAQVWVDASYEGDLLAAAGATWTIGREDRALHGERWAGRQEILPNPHQARVPVSALDADGRLLPRVVPYDGLGAPGSGDGRVQSWCYRICLSSAADRRPLAPPPGYDRSAYALVQRHLAGLVAAGIQPAMHDVLGMSELPGGKVDVNSHGPFSTDLPGAGQDYIDLDDAGRARVALEHRHWAQGLLHFLSSDPAVPASIHDLLGPYGYPGDEFTDDDGWPHQLYIREARRLEGEHVLTEADLLGGVVPADTVAMGGYNIDIREVQWVACPISRFPDLHQEALVEGYLSVPVPAYGIPYRALLPRRDDVENLLVSTCMSASAVAFSSLRMEPQYMVAGHAAGVAAAMAARRSVAAHDVEVAALRTRLADTGQVLAAR